MTQFNVQLILQAQNSQPQHCAEINIGDQFKKGVTYGNFKNMLVSPPLRQHINNNIWKIKVKFTFPHPDIIYDWISVEVSHLQLIVLCTVFLSLPPLLFLFGEILQVAKISYIATRLWQFCSVFVLILWPSFFLLQLHLNTLQFEDSTTFMENIHF